MSKMSDFEGEDRFFEKQKKNLDRSKKLWTESA
jgi:hypothetical protein